MVQITFDSLSGLEHLFESRFPDRQNIQITDFTELVEGWETKIYAFSLHYQHKGLLNKQEYVIRFFFGEEQNQQVAREFNTMALVREQRLLVPQGVLYQSQSSLFGQAFIVMDKILGPTMADLIYPLNEEDTQDQLTKMAIVFSQLHRIPPETIFPIIEGMQENYLTVQLEKMDATIKKYQIEEFEPLYAILQNGLLDVEQAHLTIIHNDYHPQNILVQEDSGMYFTIDWSFAEVGDFRLDLAWTIFLIGTIVGTQYRAGFLKSYEKESGIKIRQLVYFETLKLTQRMLTILTWINDYVAIPVHKITKETLRGDYKIHVLNMYYRLKEITGISLPTIEAL